MTSRAAVPWTVTVPLDRVAVGPVAAPAGAAATKPPAAVAITATIPASRRRCELVCMVLLLCECWCCYYASTAQLVRAAGNPSFERRLTRSRTARAPRAEEELDGAKRSGLGVIALDVPGCRPQASASEPSTGSGKTRAVRNDLVPMSHRG